MDGSVAIETNRAALVRIVASLVAMAGLARASHLPPEASNQGRSADVDAAAETVRRVGSWRQRASAPTITRHVWRTILSLLRPAESAARRLIIAAARGIVVPPPRPREPGPTSEPVDPAPFLRRFGIAVTGSPPPPRFTRSPAGASHLSRPSFGPPVNGGGSAAAAVRDLGSFTVKRGAYLSPCGRESDFGGLASRPQAVR